MSMTSNERVVPFAIAARRIRRKAEAFGSSALELMLIMNFVILLMLLAYFATIAPSATSARADGQDASNPSIVERPNTLPDRMANLNRTLETALSAARRLSEAVAEADERDAADPSTVGRPNPLPDRMADLNRTLETALSDVRHVSEIVAGPGVLNGDMSPAASGHDFDGHDWPPIIRLDEADGYSFRTNSSEISAAFARLLRTKVVPRIQDIAERFGVDTIEIVGHTDERPIHGASNLDGGLLSFCGESGTWYSPQPTMPVSVLRVRRLSPGCYPYLPIWTDTA